MVTHTMKYTDRFAEHFMRTRHGLVCKYCRAVLDPVDRLGRWNYFRVRGHLKKHVNDVLRRSAALGGAK
jgi:hypothetical protein